MPTSSPTLLASEAEGIPPTGATTPIAMVQARDKDSTKAARDKVNIKDTIKDRDKATANTKARARARARDILLLEVLRTSRRCHHNLLRVTMVPMLMGRFPQPRPCPLLLHLHHSLIILPLRPRHSTMLPQEARRISQ